MAKKIYLSPSSQPDNVYAGVDTNEQEVCRAIARELAIDLKRCGFEVKCGDYGTMYTRVAESNEWKADLHLPIHTNGFNGTVAGTRLMAIDMKGLGYKVCKSIFKFLAPLTPGTSENISESHNYEITYAIAPTAYVEIDFHDVPSVARWLTENKPKIAEAICKGICEYYGVKYVADSTPKPTPTPTPDSPVGNVSGLSNLYTGKSGNEVKIVQNLLIGKGYSCGSSGADGVFGSATDSAVKKFQADKKLTADGIVGPATWKALLGVK